MSERKYQEWYERLGVTLVETIDGEEGFRYQVGIRTDEATGATYVFIAKVVPGGRFAKGILRIPKNVVPKIIEALKKTIE